MINFNINKQLFRRMVNIYLLNNLNYWIYIWMTKRGIRMGLISQKSFYLKLFKGLYKKFINFIILRKSHANIIEMSIQPQYLYNFISTLKANSLTQLKILNDICVIDYPERTNRFELNYNLLSVKYNFRVFLKTYTSSYISSVTSIFSCANWIERECWDMFGIFFLNHPDLRRILTDYGFEGFPMRKDFPLTGYIEIRYDDEKANIVYEPLEMSQEYRLFNFTSPWEKIK